MARRAASSRLTEALLKTADDMRRVGILDAGQHRKITLRHFGDDGPGPREMTPEEIRALREKARVSQAVLARTLNLTTGYVSQLERGAKKPSGPVLVLLDVIRRKGIEAIL